MVGDKSAPKNETEVHVISIKQDEDPNNTGLSLVREESKLEQLAEDCVRDINVSGWNTLTVQN